MHASKAVLTHMLSLTTKATVVLKVFTVEGGVGKRKINRAKVLIDELIA